MQKLVRLFAVVMVVALALGSLATSAAQASKLQLTSPVLQEGGVLKAEQVANTFGCTGGNVSPELAWTGAPDGTKSFGLNMYDPDAPTGSGFWHWVVFNIPATAKSFAAGAGDPAKKLAPEGTIQSSNDAGVAGYLGACPPAGDKPHRYVVTLFALGIDKLPLDATAPAALVGFYLNGNALAKASITVTYGTPSPLVLKSPVLAEGATLKNEQVANTFGCTGGNLSPELAWAGAPDGTKSFALNVLDLDAPTGSGFWHWVIFNIPAKTATLAAGAGDPTKKLAPEGSIQSRNDAGATGYLGACPSAGDKPHRYQFTLFALSVEKLPLDEKSSGALVGFYLNVNALAKTTLTVTYGR